MDRGSFDTNGRNNTRVTSPPPPHIVNNRSFKPQIERENDQPPDSESIMRRGPSHNGVDAVWNSPEAEDVTVQLGLDLSNDVEDELETLNVLSRTGRFSLAKDFFETHLESHMDNPTVFVQYGEMLLEQGDFKSLLLLNGRPTFFKYGYEDLQDPESEIHRLLLNWKLIRAVALCHSQHTLSSVLENIEAPSRVTPKALDTNSTELKIFGLAIRLHELTRARTMFHTLNEKVWRKWTDWQGLYKRLLAEERIWDSRDILLALSESCGTQNALTELVGSESPSDQMVSDWGTDHTDESTSLALLDILSNIAMNAKTPLGTVPFIEECLRSADRIGNLVLDNFPHAVQTRQFIQWVVAKALVKSSKAHFNYLHAYPGLAFVHTREQMPYYIPIGQENPDWLPPNLTGVARRGLEMALGSFKQMKDYRSEARCLQELALRTKMPGALLDDLAHLQKLKQFDKAGYLSTCLSRYLICNDESSKESLLKSLETFGWWHDPSDIINPNTAAAKDVLQRVLSHGGTQGMKPALRYYEYLDINFAQALDRNIPPPAGEMPPAREMTRARELPPARETETKRDHKKPARRQETIADQRRLNKDQERMSPEEEERGREEQRRYRRMRREENIQAEVSRTLQALEYQRAGEQRRREERQAYEEKQEREFRQRVQEEVARLEAERRDREERARREEEQQQAYERHVADRTRLEMRTAQMQQEQDDMRRIEEQRRAEEEIRAQMQQEQERMWRELERHQRQMDQAAGRRRIEEVEIEDEDAPNLQDIRGRVDKEVTARL